MAKVIGARAPFPRFSCIEDGVVLIQELAVSGRPSEISREDIVKDLRKNFLPFDINDALDEVEGMRGRGEDVPTHFYSFYEVLGQEGECIILLDKEDLSLREEPMRQIRRNLHIPLAKSIRADLKLTQAEMAVEFEVDIGVLEHWENSPSMPLKRFFMICNKRSICPTKYIDLRL